MKIVVTRAQVGRAYQYGNSTPNLVGPTVFNYKRKEGTLDITVKGSGGLGRNFAPTWEMVLGHKRGEVSDAEYTKRYFAILDALPVDTFRRLYRFGQKTGEITFLCYCPDGSFCHTYLLMDYLVRKYPTGFTKWKGRT